MSLLDQIRDYSEGEEPAEAADAALIEGALKQAELLTPSAVHPAVIVGGVVVVAGVVAALFWPSGTDPSSTASEPAAAVEAVEREPEPTAEAPVRQPEPGPPTPAETSVDIPPSEVEVEVVPVAEPTRSPTAQPSLNDLLERAQASRAAGEHTAAAQTYRRAIRAYPKVPAARRALVTLAELELTQLGRPGAALKTFDRYLRQGKDPLLVQEAGYGRLRALRKLGRAEAEADAITAFLAAHPKSPYRKALEERRKKLATPLAPAGLNPSDD